MEDFDLRLLAQHELGAILRKARQDMGLTVDEVANVVGWPGSKLSRTESGARRISQEELELLIRGYDLTGSGKAGEFAALTRIAKRISRTRTVATRDDLSQRTSQSDKPARQVWKRLSDEDSENAIEAQLAPANLILPPVSMRAKPLKAVQKYRTNESFWEDILDEHLRANSTVALENFLLFEWFPRSPGLFHTKGAKLAREDAKHQLQRLTEDQRRAYDESAPADASVYNLHGKVKMLAGGLGCIRLLPKITANGSLWFMSASSNRAAHEGVPVAINEDHYDKWIHYITQYGAMPCSVTGKLRFLPKPLLTLYHDYTDVPAIYLEIEEIRPARSAVKLPKGPPLVSVAITFELPDSRCSAAYVSFTPGKNGSMDRRLRWLGFYATELHGGTIVTDFDEQTRRFSGAVFSLRKVCSGQLDKTEMLNFTNNSWHYIDHSIIERLVIGQFQLNHYRIEAGGTMTGDVFHNIGPNAVIVNRSNLSNAMNVVNQNADADTAAALKQIAAAIDGSGNSAAVENFNAFNEELQRQQPRKALLKSLWNGVVEALPGIVTLADATAKIAALFH